METPLSTRRVTRSQALASSGNKSNIPMSKIVEGTEKGAVKSRQRTGKQQDRSALIDITNDSPIVGLAIGSLETPSSTVSKKKICEQVSRNSGTPGSGEALLRGQVKTLLQKVEEDVEFSKISFDDVYGIEGIVLALPAPSLNNIPHASNLSGPAEEQSPISQIGTEISEGEKKSDSVESESSMITRSLLSDFSEKSEGSHDSSDCTSVLTYQGASGGSKMRVSTDDDDASIWSIQVNASTKDEEDDDVEDESNNEEDDYENEEEDIWDDVALDDLCEGLSKISVEVKFAGKHTRFVYNSDGELEGEEECDGDETADSTAGVLRLKGLPTPKGKHVRFPAED